MTEQDIHKIVERQHRFFNTGRTASLRFRRAMLDRLEWGLHKYEEELYEAVFQDLGKSKAETYMTECSLVYQEIREARRNLKKWAAPEKTGGNLGTFPAKSRIYREPYGVVLLLSPWNYPINLALVPLVGAIGAGNCVVLKGSRSSFHTTACLQRLLQEIYPACYVAALDGGAPYDGVADQAYDYIFFTGSQRVGKQIMAVAAKRLIPVSLELGGKSPCFIDRHANLKVAARRVAWGKFMNSGQTCIAVDYLLVDEKVLEPFLKALKQEISRHYDQAQNSRDYPHIITQAHYERLCGLLDRAPHVWGGARNPEDRKIAPAILTEVTFADEIMQEEIFGPVLPVIAYSSQRQALQWVKERPKPLACYIFSEDKQFVKTIRDSLSFGGGCVNDVLLHTSNHHLPFGGVGASGMGSYHGYFSFCTFSHQKGMVENTTKPDLPLRYAPYNENKYNLLRRLL